MLNENEQRVLDLICGSGGGIDVNDLINQSGLTYREIESIAQRLIQKGYQIRGLSVGDNHPVFSGWIKRFILSPYDKNYETLINKQSIGGN